MAAKPSPTPTNMGKPASAAIKLPMPIWDLPIRLFHWLLPVLLVTSYVSVKSDRMDIHVAAGYAMATLLIFRLVWGFVGSDTARFGFFLKSPLAAIRHLAHFTRREPDTQVGHNEAGGWMVLGLLGLLVVQTVTGLCANDDGETEGPLVKFVGKALSDQLSKVHDINFKLVMIAVSLHVLAVIMYAVVKRHDLVRPMLTGAKRLPAATPAPRIVNSLLALVILLVAVGIMLVVRAL